MFMQIFNLFWIINFFLIAKKLTIANEPKKHVCVSCVKSGLDFFEKNTFLFD